MRGNAVNWNRTDAIGEDRSPLPRSPSTAIDKILTNGISWRGCIRPSTKFLARELSGLHGRRVSVIEERWFVRRSNSVCDYQNDRNDQTTTRFIFQRSFLSWSSNEGVRDFLFSPAFRRFLDLYRDNIVQSCILITYFYFSKISITACFFLLSL